MGDSVSRFMFMSPSIVIEVSGKRVVIWSIVCWRLVVKFLVFGLL